MNSNKPLMLGSFAREPGCICRAACGSCPTRERIPFAPFAPLQAEGAFRRG